VTPRLNLILLLLLLVIGVPYYWYFIDNRPGDVAPRPVTIAQLRAAAVSLPGELPRGVAGERVATLKRRANWMAAGAGVRIMDLGVAAFRIDYANGAPVLINTGMTTASAKARQMEKFDGQAQARVELAMREAGLILVTGGQAEQIGGIAASGDPAILAKAAFSPAQLNSRADDKGFAWKLAKPKPRLDGKSIVAVAPGVVVVPTDVPLPGMQLIYVRLRSGAEYLFPGETAALAMSWQKLRAHARIRSDVLMHEDRAQSFAWLKTIRRLHEQAPAMHIIPARDVAILTDRNATHRIAREFPEPEPTSLNPGK